MLSLRHLIGVSGGVSLLFTGGWQVNAQSLQDMTQNTANSSEISTLEEPQPKVADLKQMDVSQNNGEAISENNSETLPKVDDSPVAPFKPSDVSQESLRKTIPEAVDPNANPLQFPTRPSEVDITTTQSITLNQALVIALENNKDLQVARFQLDERQAQLRATRSLLYPTVDFSTQFSRDRSIAIQQQNISRERDDDPTTLPNLGEESTNVVGGFELNYNVYTGGEREARIRRAEREVKQQELEVERIFEELRSDVTTRYYDLQNADASVAIAQAAIEDTTQSLRDAQLLENAGLGTRFDTLRSEVDLARAEQALTTAIADQRTARRQLAAILGVGQHIELTAADEIEETGRWPLSLEETIVQAYKNRAELEQQLISREISEQDREIALSALRPTFAFAANWQFDEDFDDAVHVANGYSFQGILSWRLFDGGQAWAEARQANRNIDIADTNFANQRELIRVEVEESYFTMISSQENIGTARQNVVLAEESLRLARLRFQAGVGTQTDVINSQRDLTDARSEFLQAVITYNQSLNDLQRAVSRLPDNRLFEQP
ncbi:MAG: TolC family protein [Microcystaceae cyanobacterium]